MEKIILFGIGKQFDLLISILEKVNTYQLEAVWDNNTIKQGTVMNVLGRNMIIEKPKTIMDSVIIVITSTIYEKEMKEQLMTEWNIPENRIKPWNYCLRSIKEQIIEKYKYCTEKEIADIVSYLNSNELDIFNSSVLKSKYNLQNTEFDVHKDSSNGLYYSWWKDKKIYLKRSFTSVKQVQSYLNGLIQEQDMESPHCYRQKKYEILPDDVIVDGGGAEGFFALEEVEHVKKVYIIEGDEEWVEALQYTFEPYQDKVEIIPKWLSDVCDDKHITLSELDKKEKITMIKLDIEGAEMQALHGALSLLKQNRRMFALICVYHKSDDAQNICNLMKQMGYKTIFSKGYMFFPYGESIEPELRKGLLFATKQMELDDKDD